MTTHPNDEEEKPRPISLLWRFYIYALHGYAVEIMFTAAWEFVVNFNWKFPGNTSVWIIPIYGISVIVIEEMYIAMHEKVPLLVRLLIYTVWTYFWEFSTGFILKQFGICPWDYTHFHGDFMGLITLEYAPLWFTGSFVVERFIMKYTRMLHWGPSIDRNIQKSALESKKN